MALDAKDVVGVTADEEVGRNATLLLTVCDVLARSDEHADASERGRRGILRCCSLRVERCACAGEGGDSTSGR